MNKLQDMPRKHPRTLQEAFGPYTSNHIHDPESPATGYPRAWWTILLLIAMATLYLIAQPNEADSVKQKCIAKYGEGFAGKYDDKGNLVDCGIRRKS